MVEIDKFNILHIYLEYYTYFKIVEIIENYWNTKNNYFQIFSNKTNKVFCIYLSTSSRIELKKILRSWKFLVL